MDDPPTSLAVSPGGEYVATTHASTTGVCVWANRHIFSSALITNAGDAPERLEMPTAYVGEVYLLARRGLPRSLARLTCDGAHFSNRYGLAGGEEEEDDEEGSQSGEGAGTSSVEQEEEVEEEDEEDEEAAALDALLRNDPAQLAQCITLSSLPASHMRAIVHADIIAERSKPAAPPVAPEATPFFLPTVAGVEHTFVAPEEPEAPPEWAGSLGAKAASAAAAAAGGAAGAAGALAGWGSDGEGEGGDDEWAAAAAAAGADESGGDAGGEAEGGAPPSKRAKPVSRIISSLTSGAPAALELSKLQRLLRAADAAAVEGGATLRAARRAAKKGRKGGAVAAAGSAAADAAHAAVLAHMHGLSAFALDAEIGTLGSGGDGAEGGRVELAAALRFFARQLECGREYELMQAVRRHRADATPHSPRRRHSHSPCHRLLPNLAGALRLPPCARRGDPRLPRAAGRAEVAARYTERLVGYAQGVDALDALHALLLLQDAGVRGGGREPGGEPSRDRSGAVKLVPTSAAPSTLADADYAAFLSELDSRTTR